MFFIRSWLGTIWIYFWIGFGVRIFFRRGYLRIYICPFEGVYLHDLWLCLNL